MSEKDKKVTSYEHHVNEILKPRLAEHMMLRDKVIEEQAEYLRLAELLERIKGKVELKTQVDIGCNFFVEGIHSIQVQIITVII